MKAQIKCSITEMMALRNTLKVGIRSFLDTSCHASQRSLCIQAPLHNHNNFSVGLNPWDEKVKLEGTDKEMHWPSYNER